MIISAALSLMLTAHTDSSAATPIATDLMMTRTVFRATSSSRAATGSRSAFESSDSKTPSTPHVSQQRPADWDGIWRDTGVIFSAQFVAGGIIYVLPESVSSWNNEQKRNSLKKYGNNFVHPAIDKDKFYINYIIHPYWGSTYYTRARERGLDKGASLLYATLVSTMFEFGAECFFEKPSIQDLLITPLAGTLLGATLIEPWRESIKRKPELRWYDHAALIATDPIGILSTGCEKLFGIRPAVSLDYSGSNAPTGATGSARIPEENRFLVVLTFPTD